MLNLLLPDWTSVRPSARFPILRAFGGALLISAGILAYLGIGFGVSAILILVVGGAVALIVALSGHRSRPADFAVFIVGVLVFGAVTAGYTPGTQVATYSATRSQVPNTTIMLDVTSSGGSIAIGFTDRADVAYQVNFTRQLWTSSFSPPGTDTVTNSTAGSVFHLSVGSTWSEISVVLGKGYTVDVDAETGTGSISLQVPAGIAARNVTLHSSTGSVDAAVDSLVVQSLKLQADTGSVSLVSHNLGAAGPSVPISVSTSTGSVSVSLNIASQDAVSVSASASLGSVSHDLRGFTITQATSNSLAATAGNVQTASQSFVITASASLGSVDLSIGFV